MSKGYGAHGKLSICNDKQVEYEYCSYNVNKSECIENQVELSGKIILDVTIFKAIDSSRRYKGSFSDRERASLKITVDNLNYQALKTMGMIQIINSSEAWILDNDGIDKHAIKLVSKIIEEYSRTEKIPQTVGVFY